MTAKSLEAQKRKLWTWFQARSAAGEKSLLSWGRDQKPPLTSGQVEQLADALVEDGVLTKERRGSGWVWLRVHDAELPESAPELELATPAPPAAAPSRPEPEPELPPPPPTPEQEAPKEPPSMSTSQPASATPAPPPPPPPPPQAQTNVDARVMLLLELDEKVLSASIDARRRLSRATAALEAAQLEVDAARANLERIARGELPEAPAPATSTATATGKIRDQILKLFRDSPAGDQIESRDVAGLLGLNPSDVSGPLSKLVSEDLLSRPKRGLYCLTPKGRTP